ncbi:MAG: GNAT family N-acetyltransferase [Pseudomonadota bacterium]
MTESQSGAQICLRPIHRSDRGRIERGIMELSDRSRYLRFFSGFKMAPPSVVERLSAIDGFHHIAWGVVDLDSADHPPIAAAHAIRSEDNGERGELAIAVLDAWHGKGIARILMAALLSDCLEQGLKTLDMAVMRENRKARSLIESLGAKLIADDVTILQYEMDAKGVLDALRALDSPAALQDVFAAFDD